MKKILSHNPYFNRWFSAIIDKLQIKTIDYGHNPYFNRWFSAILLTINEIVKQLKVTILILIDGFLQYIITTKNIHFTKVTILILIDGFLQFKQEISNKEDKMSHNPYFNRWFSAM